MRTALALLLLVVVPASPAVGQVSSSGPDYLQILARVDSTVNSAIKVEGDAGAYWFDATPVINLEQVRQAAVEQHSVDGAGFVLSLHLTEAGEEVLRRHSDQLENQPLGVIVGSQLLGAPIRSRGLSSQVSLAPDSLSLRQATELVDDLNARISRIRHE
jgi:hypothetical protein